MIRFKQFLLEASMTIDDAFKILNINPKEKYDLNKSFKDASKRHHPDLGGDSEMMKKVNLAYELLKGKGIIPGTFIKKDRKVEEAEVKQKVEIASNALKQAFNVQSYLNYFSKYISEPLEHTFREKNTIDWWGTVVQIHEFFTKDRQTVFYIKLQASLSGVNFAKSLGGGLPGLQFSYMTDNWLYHNKRKQKMKQQTWDLKSNSLQIVDPIKMFPGDILKKVFTGKKDRPFRPRDFKAGLSRELHAGFSKTSAIIDISTKDSLKLHIWRMTYLKKPMWYIFGTQGGLYQKNKQVFKTTKTLSPILETETSLNMIIELVKKLRKMGDNISKMGVEIDKFVDEIEKIYIKSKANYQ